MLGMDEGNVTEGPIGSNEAGEELEPRISLPLLSSPPLLLFLQEGNVGVVSGLGDRRPKTLVGITVGRRQLPKARVGEGLGG